ncbi:AAA family ATPase [Citrobacter braakii]
MRNKIDKDEPFFRQSWIYTADRQALMLPEPVIRKVQDEAIARREAEEEEERRKAAAQEAVVEDEPEKVDPVGPGESAPDSRVMHVVFDQPTVEEIATAGERGDRDRRPQIKRWCEMMRRDGGRRQVVPFPERLDGLGAQFPNFSKAVDVIEALSALHRYNAGDLQAESLLLCGPPGIGKTVFVEAVAQAVGAPVAGSLIPHKSGVVKRRRRVGAGGAVNGTRAARVGPRCAGGRGSIRTTDRRTAARPA